MAGKEFPLSLKIKVLDAGASAELRAFGSKLTAIATPAKSLGSAFGGVASAAAGFGRAVAGLAAGVALGGFGVYRLVKSSVDAGDALAKTADRVGLTVDAFSQLQFVAGRAGISTDEFSTAMDQFSKRLGDAKAGTGSLFTLLEKVSPTLLQQAKNAKGNGAAFDLMMRAMERLKDPSKRASLAAAAFGRSGLKMANLVKNGVVSIAELRKEYERIHGPNEAFARSSEKLHDAMQDVGTAFDGLTTSIGAELFPVFAQLAGEVKGFIIANRDGIKTWAEGAAKAISGWVKDGGIQRLVAGFENFATNVGKVVDKLGGFKGALVVAGAVMGSGVISSTISLAVAFGRLGAAILVTGYRLGALAFAPIIAAVGNFVVAIQAGYGVMEAFNLVLIANPIGLVITAIGLLAGAAYLIYKYWGPIKGFFVGVWDGLVSGVKKAWALVEPYLEKIGAFLMKWSGLGLVVGAWKGISGAFSSSGDGAPPAPARPVLNPSRAAPPSAASLSGGSTRVQVEFKNAPKGTRIKSDGDGPPIDLSTGFSMVTP